MKEFSKMTPEEFLDMFGFEEDYEKIFDKNEPISKQLFDLVFGESSDEKDESKPCEKKEDKSCLFRQEVLPKFVKNALLLYSHSIEKRIEDSFENSNTQKMISWMRSLQDKTDDAPKGFDEFIKMLENADSQCREDVISHDKKLLRQIEVFIKSHKFDD